MEHSALEKKEGDASVPFLGGNCLSSTVTSMTLPSVAGGVVRWLRPQPWPSGEFDQSTYSYSMLLFLDCHDYGHILEDTSRIINSSSCG